MNIKAVDQIFCCTHIKNNIKAKGFFGNQQMYAAPGKSSTWLPRGGLLEQTLTF